MTIKLLRDEFNFLEEHILSLNKVFFIYTSQDKHPERGKVNCNQLIYSQQSIIRELELFCKKLLNVYEDNLSQRGVYKKVAPLKKAQYMSKLKPKAPLSLKTPIELTEFSAKKNASRNYHNHRRIAYMGYWDYSKKQLSNNISMRNPSIINHNLNKSNNETSTSYNNLSSNKKLLSMSTTLNNQATTFDNKRIQRNSSMFEIKSSTGIKTLLKTSYQLVRSFHARKPA